MRKIILTTALLISSITNVHAADGFSQTSYNDVRNFNYPNSSVVAIPITLQIPKQPVGVGPSFIIQSPTPLNKSNTDSNNSVQLVTFYQDAELTMPIYNPYRIDNLADGTIKTLIIYARISSAGNSNITNNSGIFTYTANMQLFTYSSSYNSITYTATMNGNIEIRNNCKFLDSSYNLNLTAESGKETKGVVAINYNCTDQLSPILKVEQIEYLSNEDTDMAIKVYSDSNYSVNLANTIPLIANNINQTKSIYIQAFEKGNSILTKAGKYNWKPTISIIY